MVVCSFSCHSLTLFVFWVSLFVAVWLVMMENSLPNRASAPLSVLLAQVYYLLLQERNDEAVQLFASINPAATPSAGGSGDQKAIDHELQLQYDYLQAYLDFFSPNGPSVALCKWLGLVDSDFSVRSSFSDCVLLCFVRCNVVMGCNGM